MAHLEGKRSAFPGSTDKFNELFDLNHNLVGAAKRYNELRMKESLTTKEQEELRGLLAQLRDTSINPEDWNTMGDAIVNLQKFFNDNVYDYILERQADWLTYVQNFTNTGKWKSGKQYKLQNLVTDEAGNLYFCKKEHTSSESNKPVPNKDTAFWHDIGAKGDKGDPAVTTNYTGNWVSSKQYALSDSVTHVNMGDIGGLVYVAKRPNQGKNPATSPDDWQLITQIYTGVNEPLGAQVGTHFIHVIE